MARTRLYDWDAWFRAKGFRLRRGRDYRVSDDMMVQQVRNAASSRQTSIVIRRIKSGLQVTVRDAEN